MDNIGWINWAIRIAFFLFVVGSIAAFFRWLKGGKGNLKELWTILNSSLRKQVVGIALVALGCSLATLLLPLARLTPDEIRSVNTLLGSVWVVLAAWGLTAGLSMAVRVVQSNYDINVADNLLARRMHTRMQILQRIFVVIIWIGAIAGILMQYDRFRALGTTLLASAGVISIVLGISAQKTFGSIIAGIQIALSQPINLDDVVIVEGEWGRIEEVTFTYVVVKIWDQRRLILPVTYFLEHPFQNWTRKNADITGSVLMHVDYETPLAPLREEARRLCASAGALWDGRTFNLQVTEAGTEDITIRVLAGSPDASSAWDLRCMIREGLITFMKDTCPECLPKRRVAITDSVDTDGN